MHSNGQQHEPLPPPGATETAAYLDTVARALGDTPETVIARQFLREGSAEVLCVGMPEDLEGIIIQSREMPEEPMAFGSSAAAIAELLPHVAGWACINVPAEHVDDLVEPVSAAAGATSVRLLDDIHYRLDRPVPSGLDGPARLLGIEDAPALEQAATASGLGDPGRLLAVLASGHVAAVEWEGHLVALAQTFATSERYADIGVVTLPGHRGKGYGTGVAAVVARAIQADDRVPVWSCGATNLASIAIAARLGFQEVGRRTYLIPEWDDE